MTAAHGGYGSEKVPLGGGAAVCERLCRVWAADPKVELHLAAPGPSPPEGLHYHHTDLLRQPPSSLNEFAYATFSREFERQTTAIILAEKPDLVVAHDIAEGPDFAALDRAGIPCFAVFHVDVVDFFNRIYMKNLLAPERLTQLHRRGFPLPDILKLVFEKQALAVRHCRRLVVPSDPMAEVLSRCYPGCEPRLTVLPWGAPEDQPPPAELVGSLKPAGPLLVTLSRLSPEKGQHRLLQALRLGEQRGEIPPGLTLAICGGPAFMKGRSYARRLKRLAAKLSQVQVLFPGHLGGHQKRAYLEAADLFVVASVHESYGLTTLEAMQRGCPVLAVDSYGTRSTVTHDTGRLIPDGSMLELRLWCALRQMLASQQLKSWGERARQKAAESGPQQMAGKLVELALEDAPLCR